MPWTLNEDIVISGISGRFPEADNVEELWEKLMKGIPLYTKDSRRWPVNLINLPPNSGKLKDVSKFDAEMFGVDPAVAHDMDPQIRLLHEVVFETLWDAGHDPNDLRGSKTGFFYGSCYDDTLAGYREDDTKLRPYYPYPGRISYAMDWKGPVVNIDTACASSFSCFMEGLVAINSGIVDRCIIAGLAVQLRPGIANAFFQLKMLSPDGTSKCLDARADGYCRSEAVVALLLERQSLAKRVYGKVINCQTNCDGYKQEGITFPGFETQYNLLKEVYSTSKVSPLDINYVEAHITGTQAGDPVESNAIVQTLRANSTKPIMFGCLKSNIGHTEGASALCSLTKVSKILQSGYIPPNLNYSQPNPNIKPLVDGIIVPVVKLQPFQEDLIAVNSFGFGGVNVHSVIEANKKRVTAESYQLVQGGEDALARIINTSNRSEEGIIEMFKYIETKRVEVTRDFLQLVHDTSKISPETGFRARGYMILGHDTVLRQFITQITSSQPLWLILTSPKLSNLGLENFIRRFKPCAESLKASQAIIREKIGLNLDDLFSESTHDTLRNNLKSFAIQMALIDLLKELKITIDGIVSNSYGHLLAAYANSALTRETVFILLEILASSSKDLRAKLLERLPKKLNRSENWNLGSKDTVSSVLFVNSIFEESNFSTLLEQVPQDAILLFLEYQDSQPEPTRCISLLAQSSSDPSVDILESLGKIYCTGKYPLIDRLYPKVQYPVPRETPTLASFLRWDHSKTWKVAKYPEFFDFVRSQNLRKIDIDSPEQKYMEDHCIDGRILLPATGYLFSVWDYVSRLEGSSTENTPIVFRKVKLHRATLLSRENPTILNLQINHQTRHFQVTEGHSLVVEGFVEVPDGPLPNYRSLMRDISDPSSTMLKTKDIYKELRLRGYDYGPSFQGLVEAKSDGSYGKVKYTPDQWVSFADALLQIAILGENKRQLYLPTYFELLRCDPEILSHAIEESKKSCGEPHLEVFFDKEAKLGACNGLYLTGLKASAAPRRFNSQNVLLEEYTYVPYENQFFSSIESDKSSQEYSFLCGQCLKKLEDREASIDEKRIKAQLDRGLPDRTLLKVLFDTLTKVEEDTNLDPKQVLIENIKENEALIAKDVITSEALRALIYHHISVVAENTAVKNISITEFNESRDFLFDSIMDMLHGLGVRPKVNLVHSLSNEDVSRAKLIQSPIDSDSLDLPELSDFIVFKDHRLSPTITQESISRSLSLQTLLESVNKNLKPGGFFLACYRNSLNPLELDINTLLHLPSASFHDLEDLTQEAEKLGLLTISNSVHQNKSMYACLFRKPDESNEHITIDLTDGFEWIAPLRQELTSSLNHRVWLKSVKTPLTGVVGMVNCLRKEPNGDRIRCLYDAGENDHLPELTDDLIAKDLVFNVFKSNENGSYRHRRLDANADVMTQARHVYLDVKTRGDLSSLRWYKSLHDCWTSFPSSPKMSLAHVYYGALNFKDVMVASGRIPVDAYPSILLNDCLIGMEFAGIDENGKRIMGTIENKAIASTILVDYEQFIFEVPDKWTLEEAATVPVVYLTAYYALFLRGNLQAGEKVLIHAGSGGVGQAAISICLKKGCEVFTTVGTKEKREFLKRTFPQLDDRHIGDSRSTTFEEMILRETNGYGVDVVLNSLSEDKFKASARCLAEFGRFLEIGKYDLVQNNPLEEVLLDCNRTYHAICLAHLEDDIFVNFKTSAIQMKKTLEYLIYKGIENGEVRPLSTFVFGMDQVEDAFRFMATGKHMGKVLIKIMDDSEDYRMSTRIYPCIAQTSLDPEKVYIITGGLGGVGLELGNWLLEHGASKLLLTSRSGPKEPYQLMALHKLRNKGRQQNTVIVSKNDGLSYSSVADLLEEAKSHGSIGGIFHLAMVLNDAIFENQSEESFQQVCAPKIRTTKYLDSLTRQVCPDLDYFVCFSSVASGKGNPGQTNYAFANSFMERICEQRRRDGLHGLAIQWGAIGDVGIVAERFEGNQIVLGGTLPQRISSCMSTLDKFLQLSLSTPLTVGSSIVLADAKKSSSIGKENLLRSICHIIGVKDMTKLDPNNSLSDLGLDSLMAVEIKQGLERDYDIVLSTQEIRNLKIKEIQDLEEKIIKNKLGKGSESSGGKNIKLNITNPTELFVELNSTSIGVPVFVWPPIEGDFDLIKPILQSIDRPIFGLNWIAGCDDFNTIEEVAGYYIEKILEAHPNQSGFDLVGYSFGGLIALEVAIQLQKARGQSCIRSFSLLDSSPAYLKHVNAELLKSHQLVSEDEAHVNMLLSFVTSQVSIENPQSVRASLLTIKNKEERAKKLNELLEAKLGQTIKVDQLTKAADMYFKKMKMVYYYNPSDKFIGNVKVFRAEEGFKAIQGNCSQEMGLEEVIDGDIEIISLSGDHKSFLKQHEKEISDKLYSSLSIIIS